MSSRRLLISTALLGLAGAASPAAAQTTPTALWSSDRPDAVAPIGVFGDRLQAPGSLQLTVLYSRTGAEGIRFGSELVDPSTLFSNFELVPLSLSSDGYFVRAQYGISDRVSLAAEGGFVRRTRQQITQDLVYFPLEAEGPTDIRAQLLFNLFDNDAVKAHVHLGGSAPVGSTSESDGEVGLRTAGTLPYDMQLGAGGWGVSPGITAKVMNEYGSVGGQIIGTMYFGSKNGWRAGDQVEMNGWAAYRLNRFFSISAGAHLVSFETIQGFNPALNPDRDPGELPISFGGKRVDLPVGVNLYLPEGSWAGHRISVEFDFPVHEDFEGPWLAGKRGLTIGWQKAF